MTRLLVSVRDADEARAAIDAGVHLIDVKEPLRGALGAADFRVIKEVVDLVGGRAPVSAALGELLQQEGCGVAPDLRRLTVSFVKWGLADAAARPDWSDIWGRALTDLRDHATAVAVQYADWWHAKAPPPRALLAACRAYHCNAVLVDTFEKSRGNLLDIWPLDDLRSFVAAARDAGMMVALAGSLTSDCIPRVLPLAPDYIAVRGAVCVGGREGHIDARRIRGLLAMLGP